MKHIIINIFLFLVTLFIIYIFIKYKKTEHLKKEYEYNDLISVESNNLIGIKC